MSRARHWLQPRRRDLLPDEEPFSNLLYLPALDPIERRGSQGFTRAQTETRMMPRATHFVANYQALGKRAVVVRAVRAYGKELRAASYEQDFFVPRHSQEVAAVWNAGNGNSISKVRLFGIHVLCLITISPDSTRGSL